LNTEKNRTKPASGQAATGSENCLAIGSRLNDFEIIGVLGEGGFGIVYLAFDHSLQRTVAIKEYLPGSLAGRAEDGSVMVRAERHQATFDAGKKSFINEARLLAQFDHPALVKVYRFWEENKTAYMVMRHYHGDTLKDIVLKRPELITEAWLKFVFKQILEALDTLYKTKVLHRDVSPDNIIVQKNGEAVLLDFGSARQIIGDMTQGLTVILKPGYAPVEQYSDEDNLQQGPWTDIFSLAAVMYFLITKTPPPMAVARIVKDTMPPLHQRTHTGFSEKFLLAVDQGLAVMPKDRPQSMDEFRRLLGISAFVSARNARSGAAYQDVGDLDEADEIANLARIKDVAYTPPVQSEAQRPAEVLPAILPSKLSVRLGGKAGLIGMFFFIAVVLSAMGYFSMHEDQQKLQEASDPAASPSLHSAAKMSQEELIWNELSADSRISAVTLTAFLQQFPDGKFSTLARSRLKEFTVKDAQLEAGKTIKQKQVQIALNIRLLIKPWGTVFVDGVQSGTSPPLKTLSLTGGKHKIRVTNPGFPDFLKEIDVGKDNLRVIKHEFITK
jgi:serine/threonine protein kinase